MSTPDIDRIVASWLAGDLGQVDPAIVDAAITDAVRRGQRRGIAAMLARQGAWPPSPERAWVSGGSVGLRIALLAVVGLVLVIASAALLVGGPRLRLGISAPSPSVPLATAAPTDRPRSSDVVASGTILFDLSCLNTIDVATGAHTQNCDTEMYPVPGGGTTWTSWSWSPDGRRAIGLGATSLVLRNSTDPKSTPIRGTEWRQAPVDGGQTAMPGQALPTEEFIGWSPRGTYIIWFGEGAAPGQWTVFVGTPDDPRRSEIGSPGDSRSSFPVQWSADESRAVVSTNGIHARLMNGDGSPLPGALDFDVGQFLGFSNDAKRLAFLAPRGGTDNPVAIDVAVGDGFSAPTAVTSFADGTFAVAAAWSVDDSTLAIVTSPRKLIPLPSPGFELWLVNRDGSRRQFALTLPPGAFPGALAWSADGTHLIVTSQEAEHSTHPYRMWAKVVSTVDGLATAEDAGGAVFSPDGRHVFYDAYRDDGTVDLVLMDLATGRSRTVGSSLVSLGNARQLSWRP